MGGHAAIFKSLFKETAKEFPELTPFVENLEISAWDIVYKQQFPSLDSIDAVLDQEEVPREVERRSEGQRMGRRNGMKERGRAMGNG
jgi:hypothetical protein